MNESLFVEEQKNLLILESGLQLSREYWLQDFIALGFNLFLAQPWAVTWERPYIKEYLQVHFNPWTSEEIEGLLKFISDNKIHGIICLNEGTVPFASDILAILNLPLLSKEDIRNLRNKVSMRKKLLNSGILQPEFIFIDELAQIENLEIKFPAVVKPTEMMASLGVKLVKNKSELIQAINNARNVDFNGEDLRQHYGFNKGVLVESYLKGDEYSVETFVQNGEIIDFFVTQKYKCAEPYFDEIGHLANPQLSDSIISEIKSFINSLHKNLGILNSITHTEIKIDGNQVRLIEIGCRPGGDLIPLIHNLSASLSFANVMAKIHMGIQIRNNWLPITSRKQVAVFFPHDHKNYKAIKHDLVTILNGVKIHQFIFDENSEPINNGLATSRRGQIVFSHEKTTKDILQQLVKLSGGI